MKTLCYSILIYLLTFSQFVAAQNVDDFGSPVLGKGQPAQSSDKIDASLRTSQSSNWAMVIAGGAAFALGLSKVTQRQCNNVTDGSGATTQDCSYPQTNSGIALALLGAGAAGWGLWRMNVNSNLDEAKTAYGKNEFGTSAKSNLFFASTGQQHSLLFKRSF